MKKNNIIWIFVAVLCLGVCSSCKINPEKNNDVNAVENVISEELHQAHCDLLAKANQELSEINQKVRNLNNKISEGGKLSDTQNAMLDEFEVKQASINKRMHEIKNIKQEDWENFKATFEKDLEDIRSTIDKILAAF